MNEGLFRDNLSKFKNVGQMLKQYWYLEFNTITANTSVTAIEFRSTTLTRFSMKRNN